MSFLVQLSRNAYPGLALDKFTATAQFSLDNARSMMWMAQLAYETPGDNGDEASARKKVADILDGWQMKLRGFKRNDPLTGLPHRSACLVAGGGLGATIIAFAGSDPLKVEDWVTDFTPAPSLDDVHRGFEGAVNSVWDDIEAAIRARPPSEQPLFFTGHSLGGALAIIAADFAVTRTRRQRHRRLHLRQSAHRRPGLFRPLHAAARQCHLPPDRRHGPRGHGAAAAGRHVSPCRPLDAVPERRKFHRAIAAAAHVGPGPAGFCRQRTAKRTRGFPRLVGVPPDPAHRTATAGSAGGVVAAHGARSRARELFPGAGDSVTVEAADCIGGGRAFTGKPTRPT